MKGVMLEYKSIHIKKAMTNDSNKGVLQLQYIPMSSKQSVSIGNYPTLLNV